MEKTKKSKRQRVTIYISPNFLEAIRELAREKGMSLSGYVNDVVFRELLGDIFKDDETCE